MNRVFVHLTRKGGVSGIAPVGVGRSRNAHIVGAVIHVHIIQVAWIVVIHEHGPGSLAFTIGIQVARAKNGSRNVVPVGTIGGAGFIG